MLQRDSKDYRPNRTLGRRLPAALAPSFQTPRRPPADDSKRRAKKLRAWNARKRPGPGRVVPRHVEHCSATGARDWWIYTWKKAAPNKIQRAPYTCRSWRCPSCREHEAAVTFARIKQAFKPLEAMGVVFLVLTLDRDGYYSGKPWKDPASAYRALSHMSRCFLKRLNRLCVARGWPAPRSRWVAVVEAHRSGWPHVNLMIYCPELALELERDRVLAVARGATQRESVLLSGELLYHATATGWGPQSTAERARSKDALAGYVTKLAGEANWTTGELAKVTQSPVNAPVRFRRLRSGKGFLPPRYRDPTVSGTLVRRRRDYDGTVNVMPLHDVSPETLELVAACCYHEQEIAHAELAEANVRRLALRILPRALVDGPFVTSFYLDAGGGRETRAG